MFFIQRMVKIWNLLPKELDTITTFRKHLDSHSNSKDLEGYRIRSRKWDYYRWTWRLTMMWWTEAPNLTLHNSMALEAPILLNSNNMLNLYLPIINFILKIKRELSLCCLQFKYIPPLKWNPKLCIVFLIQSPLHSSFILHTSCKNIFPCYIPLANFLLIYLTMHNPLACSLCPHYSSIFASNKVGESTLSPGNHHLCKL